MQNTQSTSIPERRFKKKKTYQGYPSFFRRGQAKSRRKMKRV
jgi:hypothetical protein